MQLRKQEGTANIRVPPMQGPHHTSKGIGQDTKSLSPPATFSFLRPAECNSTAPVGINLTRYQGKAPSFSKRNPLQMSQARCTDAQESFPWHRKRYPLGERDNVPTQHSVCF